MSTITTRAGKGSPLTNNEVDANFTNLNTDKAELSGAAFTGAITTTSTVDGRDVATDGSKLDGIEAGADVTDTANVTAAGALMDSELTSIASVKALNQGVATTDSPDFAALNVNGTATMDGLISSNVSGTTLIQAVGVDSNGFADVEIKSIGTSGASRLYFSDTAAKSGSIKYTHSSDAMLFSTAGAARLNIASNGDISFYEDTGTTAKLFWDASAERLGLSNLKLYSDNVRNEGGILYIGTSGNNATQFYNNDANTLHISGAGNVGIGTGLPNIASFGKALTITDPASTNQIPAIELAFGSNTRGANIAVDNRASVKALAITAVASDLAMTFGTNNTERMRIDSAGNVGIGTDSPSSFTGYTNVSIKGGYNGSNLDFHNSSGTRVSAIVSNPSADFTVETNTTIPLLFKTNSTERMRITSGGILEFNDNAVISVNDTADSMYLGGGGTLPNTIQSQASALHNWQIGASNVMRIDASGNLLVGVTSPQDFDSTTTNGHTFYGGSTDVALHSRNNANPLALQRTGNDGSICNFYKDTTTVGSIGTASGDLNINGPVGHSGIRFQASSILPRYNGADTDGTMDLGYNDGTSTHRWRDLHLSGKIAKGTGGELDLRSDGGGFAYKQNLDVATAGCTFTGQSTRGDMAAIRLYQTATGADGGYVRFDTSNSGSTTLTEKARIDSAGRLLVGYTAADGIGGAPSDNNFSELGKGYINLNRDDTATARQIQFGKNGVVAGYIQTAGSTTSYVTSSDQRLKENIADADDAGSKIDAIQVRKYDWKADGSHQDYGMIAQELQAVAPDAVSGDADSEEMMGVDYSKLVPMLVKEIQSLRNRVAQLEE